MKSRSGLFMLLVVIMLVLAACGGAPASTEAPPEFIEPAATEPAATEAPAFEAPSFAEEPAAKEGESVSQDQVVGAGAVSACPQPPRMKFPTPRGI